MKVIRSFHLSGERPFAFLVFFPLIICSSIFLETAFSLLEILEVFLTDQPSKILAEYAHLLPLVMEMHVLATHLKLLAIETLHFYQCFEFTQHLFQSIRTKRIRGPLLAVIAIESFLCFLNNTRPFFALRRRDFVPPGLEASTFADQKSKD